MDASSEGSASIAFGRFHVLPRRRELLADGQPVKLGGRAFDMLMALIEARGAVIGKHALMARVWPDQVVEENNLQAQISDLRAAFGAERHLIRTVSGRGYQFTGDVRILSDSADERPGAAPTGVGPAAVLSSTNLPQSISELVGRDNEVSEILSLATAHRLGTLVGAGGIGKTRLAIEVARRLLPQFADGVWIAELAPLSDPALVPVAVASAIGLDFAAGAVSPGDVAKALTGRRLLLVLDNCEHVIDAAASMAESLLHADPAVHVIATSREPLRAEGEWVYPVPALNVPAADAEKLEDPLQYGAIRLFVERARATGPHLALDGQLSGAIAAICRRLDGIPLAIELAAARAATLGVGELFSRLDDRFHLLTAGRRGALPRHQTLRATLDWSYELLSERERMLLRRLAIFAGPFSVEGASAIVASPDLPPPLVVDGLHSLIGKSLVVAQVDPRVTRYHLLDTTRTYALEKLVEAGERPPLRRRHAEFALAICERAEAELETRSTAEWLADYGWRMDNLHAALDWAFSPTGDANIGIALTAAAVPLWLQSSLMKECRRRAEQALAVLGTDANGDRRCEMKLHAALGASLTSLGVSLITPGTPAEVGALWAKTLEIAEELDDTEYRLRALWGLWVFHTAGNRHRTGLALARRFSELALKRPGSYDRLFGERMLGASLHYLGDQAGALRHHERLLAADIDPRNRSYIVRFQLDLRVMANVFLARVLWLQGFPDKAISAAERGFEDARATGHAITVSYALTLGICQISLLVGDTAAAERYVGLLLDHSTRHGLTYWHAFGRCQQAAIIIMRGDLGRGLPLLRAAFDELGLPRAALRFITLRMMEALGRAGQVSEGLAAAEEAINHSQQSEELWALPELLRIKGELLLLQGAPGGGAAAAEQFRQALDWASRQNALAWELRAATSLARLLRDQSRTADALALLQTTYDRFTEGFGTTDLKTAKALLDSLK